jgi:hypothetical protein
MLFRKAITSAQVGQEIADIHSLTLDAGLRIFKAL